MKIGLLFQPVHEKFKVVLADLAEVLADSLLVDDVEPRHVLLVHVVLDLLVLLLGRLLDEPVERVGHGRGIVNLVVVDLEELSLGKLDHFLFVGWTASYDPGFIF